MKLSALIGALGAGNFLKALRLEGDLREETLFMERAEKHQFVKDFTAVVGSHALLVVTEQTGLSADESMALRAKVREHEASFKIVKNTLLRLALKGSEAESLVPHLKGPTGFAYSKDPLAAAKAVADFSKKNEKLKILAGSLNGAYLDAAAVKELASLPSLDELRGKIVGLLTAPMGALARVMNAPASSLARVVQAYSEKGS